MSGSLRNFRTLMGFSLKAAPREATFFLTCAVIMSLLPAGMAYGAKLLVDAAVQHDVTRGVTAAILLSVCAGLSVLNTMFYVDFLFTVAERTGSSVDRRLIALMAGIPGLEHHERPDYLDQMDLLREERSKLAWMTNALAGMVRVAVLLIVSGVLLAQLNPALLLLPLAGFASFAVGRRAQEMQMAGMESSTEDERLRRHLFDVATDAEAGKETRVFNLTGELVRRHRAVARRVSDARDSADWHGAVLQALGGIITGAAYVGAIWLVLIRAINGEGTPGDVVLAVGLAATLNATITTAVLYGTQFLRILRLAGRYLWLADYAERHKDRAHVTTPVPPRLTDGIELKNVTFRYPGTETTILDAVSLYLPPGAVVAIVGDNGVGKTTLVKLLLRLYEPTSGHILVDGVELNQFPSEAWRARVSAGFQDFARFEFRVREVVGIGDLPQIENREAVRHALVQAGAGGLPAVLSHGLETPLGKEWDGGVELSGGQWQKLALSRAMMRPLPLLLVLDEPTASLDADTEHALFQRYAEAARGTGSTAGTITILISHRFSTVRMADLIIVLDGGHISEYGSHDVLMAMGGLYAELYELQARQYR